MRETMQVGALARAAEDIRAALMTTAAAIPEMDRRRGPAPQGPHLVERRSRTDPGKVTLYIRDGRVETSTRLPPERRAEAETLLDLYKLQKGARERGIVGPRMVPVAAALAHLLDAERPVRDAPPAEHSKYVALATRLATLASFFGEDVFKDVTTARCKAFIDWRTSQPDARYRPGTPDAPLAKEASAREDLFELRKAIDLYADENALAWHPEVFVPKSGPGRTRWLRRPEVARIVWAIRGRIWDAATGDWKRETVVDAAGDVVTRLVLRDPETVAVRRIIYRLLVLGLYTGTRGTAMRELRWECSADGGCIDVEGRHIHRRGFGLDPSQGKPRASSRISTKLATTVARWRDADRAAGIAHVIHRPDGQEYLSTPIWLWNTIMADAGIGSDVVRHTLRHTAATWLRIARVDVRAAADVLGMSIQTMVRIYGQWTLEGQDVAADALALGAGVKAATFFGIPAPKPLADVLAPPVGAPPRAHPTVALRRKRDHVRANGASLRARVGYAPAGRRGGNPA
ncbi:tyrosine-type recombinase/integrase [Methylobacterium sp. 092160098-2]|uniref:tyrosine-type recombinase/integrase n=1 Tax=Methylobacterium sp. 092160098-2 TaxID=3025129 RepID=UPI002381C223|nr:tyrosine-type recombinase/integrase [Methylobacterium sp. 092160098-2]MDE4911231.1 tyrosine-type recombinase/integrase [Methylobacterium sp. 092160098-2]